MVQDTTTPVKKKLNIWKKILAFFSAERKAYVPPVGSSAAKLNDMTYQARLQLFQKENKELTAVVDNIIEACRQRALAGYYYLEIRVNDEPPELSITDENYDKVISRLEKEKGCKVTHVSQSMLPWIKIEW